MTYEFAYRPQESELELCKVETGTPRGTWGLATENGKTHLKISCPRCGHIAELNQHTIVGNGVITPSMHCSNCGWSDEGRLGGWVNGIRSKAMQAIDDRLVRRGD